MKLKIVFKKSSLEFFFDTPLSLLEKLVERNLPAIVIPAFS
jgi:hypothetical protein